MVRLYPGFTMHEIIELFIEWILNFGGPILFFLLVLGIVGLPVPDETLLVVSGWLVAKGKLDFTSILVFSILGSICGITISYWLGRRAGPWFIKKFGKKLRLTEKRVTIAYNWYNKIGKWILLIGYFIPVVRHLAGFIAGSSRLNLRDFFIFAYSGAIIWSLTFLSLGYFLLIEVFPHAKNL